MSVEDFDYWVSVLRANFPDDPRLPEVGRRFVPATPEQVQARRNAYFAAHPVVEMRDQDGARRALPDPFRAIEWLEVMRPGDSLTFLHSHDGTLFLEGPGCGPFSVRRSDASGRVVAHEPALDEQRARVLIWRYLEGDVAGCDEVILQAHHGSVPAAYPSDLATRRSMRGLDGIWSDNERRIAFGGEPPSKWMQQTGHGKTEPRR
jgi:hypothetical protein